ncbi:NAD(P)-dependent oxidoreductase [Phenylobacterium sp.]|uniref:precorrin-2 dehydrogenase/sirohydrochlorin ferrochelatase family protein n=1 Tax=Phenylobacterium sp. TaxID=1871053 RepID=UPI0035AF3BAD
MDAFPAFFPLAGRKVVVAGQGEAAEAKARLFEGSPAVVVRLEGPQAFLAGAYAGAVLAFVASEDELFAQAAARAARAAHVPVNVVDRPQMCDFTTPAVIDRGEVVAAIGTGGASPMLATLLRHDIEARVPEGAGRVAALLRRLQDEVRAALPDLARRRAFLRAQLSGPAAEAAMAGDAEGAADLLRQALAKAEAGGGRVQFVAGRGPVDLLTLKAVRALAAADVLAPDADADPQILALARRDAERLAPEQAGPEALAALARAGRAVVRVVVHPADPEALRVLAQAGVEVEVLPTAAG